MEFPENRKVVEKWQEMKSFVIFQYKSIETFFRISLSDSNFQIPMDSNRLHHNTAKKHEKF